jgi:hypothetical protein
MELIVRELKLLKIFRVLVLQKGHSVNKQDVQNEATANAYFSMQGNLSSFNFNFFIIRFHVSCDAARGSNGYEREIEVFILYLFTEAVQLFILLRRMS